MTATEPPAHTADPTRRRETGEVATAYGVRREPSDVTAGGQNYPLRFRCRGREHRTTDISCLPDLETYHAGLPHSPQKLTSAFETDAPASRESMPLAGADQPGPATGQPRQDGPGRSERMTGRRPNRPSRCAGW